MQLESLLGGKGLTKKVTSEQKLEGGEGEPCGNLRKGCSGRREEREQSSEMGGVDREHKEQ